MSPLDRRRLAGEAANKERSMRAAARTVERARTAIALIESAPPLRTWARADARKQYLFVLKLRVAHPEDSLAALAARADMTKDAYWSVLRRGLLHANNIGRRAAS